ncbi:glycosyltransferase family 2 protein [Pelobium manganitolerans]|uniref:glycosyltransferase family 2 protein n=1 Tax=Pelobium manganitolerans TaxID=1842495 RepID=UPI003FA38615
MKNVSVIIPTYNREKLLPRAIESVLSQDFTGEIEIVIADDGSTDDTLKIASAYGNTVKFVAKPADCKTQGPSSTRNRGIKAATQPYILFLDSDDYFFPGHIKKMVEAIEENADYGYIFCRILEINEATAAPTFRLWSKEKITQREVANLNIASHNVAQTNGFIFKKEVFDKVGVFHEDIYHGEDIDLWMRVSEFYKGNFSDHYGAALRRNGADQLTADSKESLLKIQQKVFRNALKRYFRLRLNNPYRLAKLLYINLYYVVIQLPLCKQVFLWWYERKNKKADLAQEWHPLSYFIKD